MPSRDTYRTKLGGTKLGDGFRKQSDMLIEATWNTDLQSKECYIYDYFHDSEPDLARGLSPWKDPLKTKIEAKYIVTQYSTLSKDQVEYHLMFKPSQKNPLSYFDEKYKKWNVEFPIGLFIDVPDERGIYNRWLICSRDREQQFVKYSILPCNYLYKWIYKYQKYQMWGVARLQSSYNSGVWTDFKFTSQENQNKIWLPINEISLNIYYDQRIIISTLMEKPITWQVSKIENVHPFGIQKITVIQTKFDPNVDYVNLETGEMYADYYKNMVPLDEPTTLLSINSLSKTLKIGGTSKRITSSEKIVKDWKFVIDGLDITTSTTLLSVDYGDQYVDIKFLGDESYIGKVLEITCNNAVISLEIVSL